MIFTKEDIQYLFDNKVLFTNDSLGQKFFINNKIKDVFTMIVNGEVCYFKSDKYSNILEIYKDMFENQIKHIDLQKVELETIDNPNVKMESLVSNIYKFINRFYIDKNDFNFDKIEAINSDDVYQDMIDDNYNFIKSFNINASFKDSKMVTFEFKDIIEIIKDLMMNRYLENVSNDDDPVFLELAAINHYYA